MTDDDKPKPEQWRPPPHMIKPINYAQHFRDEKARQQLTLRLENATAQRRGTETASGTDQS